MTNTHTGDIFDSFQEIKIDAELNKLFFKKGMEGKDAQKEGCSSLQDLILCV